jgi:hypothetical protein
VSKEKQLHDKLIIAVINGREHYKSFETLSPHCKYAEGEIRDEWRECELLEDICNIVSCPLPEKEKSNES